MAAYEIIGMVKVFTPDVLRQGKLDRAVTYRGEDQVLHVVLVPDEGFTLQAAQAAVAKAEQERRLATPVKFTIP